MPRKTLATMAVLAVALLLTTGVALADRIRCKPGECRGTQQSDIMTGSTNADQIFALGGDDEVDARGGGDRVNGGAGNDRILGESGKDRLDGGVGADRIVGGDVPTSSTAAAVAIRSMPRPAKALAPSAMRSSAAPASTR